MVAASAGAIGRVAKASGAEGTILFEMKTKILVAVSWAVLALVGAGRAAEQTRWHVFNHERVLGTSLEMKFAAASGVEANAAEAAARLEYPDAWAGRIPTVKREKGTNPVAETTAGAAGLWA